ncbi:MAG TPA: steroid 3-ketoacyl-CoA thiolase, partial [Microbacteriaceae bacterium]|jgi:acetyl-CoA C-acetyltransferase|nr:steroid 3-ketoacyl-CoA thiolase [Microbacteriaceae bacterium]
MNDVVIVGAVRTPFGRRNGVLSGYHSIDLLAGALKSVVERAGIDPAEVGQVIGGCVSQVGMQAMNVTRQAWLTAGLPYQVPATTVDSQCGSSQQAMTLAWGLVKSGAIDVAIACGVELMSKVPLGSNVPKDGSLGKAVTRSYWQHHTYTSQFQAAELIADKWSITRSDTDAFGVLSQERAARATAEHRFDTQFAPVSVESEQGSRVVTVDEGLRKTTLEGLADLRTNLPDGIHTAGTSSQVSDGASALVLMSAERARALGLTPLATVVDSILVGSDPELMLTGPIDATRKLLDKAGLGMGDLGLVEINEAFAAVVLAWERELKTDLTHVNPNGGAIALGHPLGATGVGLLTKAVYEMNRTDTEHALVTMCCGGGLATGTLLRR